MRERKLYVAFNISYGEYFCWFVFAPEKNTSSFFVSLAFLQEIECAYFRIGHICYEFKFEMLCIFSPKPTRPFLAGLGEKTVNYNCLRNIDHEKVVLGLGSSLSLWWRVIIAAMMSICSSEFRGINPSCRKWNYSPILVVPSTSDVLPAPLFPQ